MVKEIVRLSCFRSAESASKQTSSLCHVLVEGKSTLPVSDILGSGGFEGGRRKTQGPGRAGSLLGSGRSSASKGLLGCRVGDKFNYGGRIWSMIRLELKQSGQKSSEISPKIPHPRKTLQSLSTRHCSPHNNTNTVQAEQCGGGERLSSSEIRCETSHDNGPL